ncbi:MAG: hypothetical protein NVSMB53_17100 [Gemmatimonadaceae bacterium]
MHWMFVAVAWLPISTVAPRVDRSVPHSAITTARLQVAPSDSARVVGLAKAAYRKGYKMRLALRVLRFTRTDSGYVVDLSPIPQRGTAIFGGGATVFVSRDGKARVLRRIA